MATTYSEAKVALAEIATRIRANANRLAQAAALIQQAETDLAAMPTQFGTIISDIGAAAQANSSNTALVAAKAESDLLVAEFTELKTRATTLKTSIAGK